MLSTMRGVAVLLAYLGGAVISAVALMSVVSIVGRSTTGRTITGDFELVEVGIGVAAALFLPYCQATRGHIVVDFFTLKAGPRTIGLLDRIGHLLMAITLLAIGWRTGVAAFDIWQSAQTTMLRGFPLWIGYAAAVPGVLIAGLTALLQVVAPDVFDPAAGEARHEQG